MIPGHELKHLPMAEAMRVQQASIEAIPYKEPSEGLIRALQTIESAYDQIMRGSAAPQMIDARQEVAILRSELHAARARELSLDATIRDLRRELLEAHDIAGRAEGAAERTVYIESRTHAEDTPGPGITDWRRADTRKVGG